MVEEIISELTANKYLDDLEFSRLFADENIIP